jgi:hypothetical protein
MVSAAETVPDISIRITSGVIWMIMDPSSTGYFCSRYDGEARASG